MFGLTRKDWFYCFVTASVTLVWGYFMIVTVMEPLRIAESSVCEKLEPLVRDAATAAAKKNGEFTSLVEGLNRG